MQLNDICELIVDCEHKTAPTQDSGYPSIRTPNIGRGFFILDGVNRVSEETYRLWSRRATPQPGDLIMAREAPVGNVAMIPVGLKPCLGQRTLLIRPNRAHVEPAFLSYLLNGPYVQSLIQAKTNGATVSHLNMKDVRTLQLPPLPTLPIQHRIAGILSAYDELIENSQQRIKVLESMARVLYRQALEMSKELATPRPIAEWPYWRFISENVSEYFGTKRYFATADIDGLAVTGSGIDYLYAEKPSRAQKQPISNSVWFARMKETYKIAWYGPQEDERVSGIVLSSGFAGFEAKDEELWPLLFLTISSREFHVQKDLYCTGATQMSLTNEGMARIVLPIPDEQSARRLGRSAGPMLNAIAGLQRRHENLRRTRDLLLPRLLSGQIDVEEIPA